MYLNQNFNKRIFAHSSLTLPPFLSPSILLSVQTTLPLTSGSFSLFLNSQLSNLDFLFLITLISPILKDNCFNQVHCRELVGLVAKEAGS
uniref:Uncharacterized protein n=1 Tax=Salix viminalis TaxID=40686 RepID=A0A6N2KIE4_SALVM